MMIDKQRAALQAALNALLRVQPQVRGAIPQQDVEDAIDRIRAALAEPVEFDHGIGADRFKVVRGAFWWHVLIGDSPTKHGKFGSRADAEKMAATLLREFRNGAFVQHEAALAEPEAKPVAWIYEFYADMGYKRLAFEEQPSAYNTPLYTAPHRREWVGLANDEIYEIASRSGFDAELVKLNKDKGLPSIAEFFARNIEGALKRKNT